MEFAAILLPKWVRSAVQACAAIVILSTAAGCIATGGSPGREDAGVEEPADGRLGSGLASLMTRDSSEEADKKQAKPGKGKRQRDEESQKRRAREKTRSAEDEAGWVIGSEGDDDDDYYENEYEPSLGSAALFSFDRTDFALLVHGGTFSQDLDEDGSTDFEAGESWGLETAVLLRNEFGSEVAIGLSYGRLKTDVRPDLLSEGSLVMQPLLVKAEYSNVIPGLRRLRFVVGFGLGLSLNEHELSKEMQADCAAQGYACSEKVGTGFAAQAHIGPRYRITPWLEGQAMLRMGGSSQNVKIETIDLATGEVARAESRAEFQWARGSLGLRFLF